MRPAFTDDTAPERPAPVRRFSAFIPVTLLSIALMVMSWYNYSILSSQSEMLQRQIGQQQEAVARTQEAQGKARALLADLLSLAESDPQAAAIVQKHRIQRVPNQAAPPAEAPNP